MMENNESRKRGRPRKIKPGIPFKKKKLVPEESKVETGSISTTIEPVQDSKMEVDEILDSNTNHHIEISNIQSDTAVPIDASGPSQVKSQIKKAACKGIVKVLTLNDLLEVAPVNVMSVSTDLCYEECSTGPWPYMNSSRCVVKFIESNVFHSMRLNNFLNRGLSHLENNLNFRWYSWLQLKSIAKKQNISITSVLTDRNHFMSLLRDVNQFYTKNAKKQREEYLEANMGPQSIEDSQHLERLYYYGNGKIRYYRKTTFLELLARKYGEIIKAEYLVNPATPLITEDDYEFLLTEVQGILYKNYSRHLKKLEEFAGPQCNEDRTNSDKINYDVKFASSSKATKVLTNTQKAMIKENKVKDTDFGEFFLRKCEICKKIRWIGKKAAEKFVLGSYTYAGVKRNVQFSCNLLHNSSCDDESDIVHLKSIEHCSSILVAFNISSIIGFVFRIIRSLSQDVHEVEVLAKYSRTNHKGYNHSVKVMYIKLIAGGYVELGNKLSTSRFQRMRDYPKFLLGNLNTNKPREALVCQSWLDSNSFSSENPNAYYTVTTLCGIRDIHAVYKAMKMIHCIHCGMCSPGFAGEIDECVIVPEAGRQVPLYNNTLLNSLQQSRVLSCASVVLDGKFAAARVFENESVKGICTDCSKYCTMDENGQIALLHYELSRNLDQSSQETVNSQEPISDNVSNINPYSVGNLMALDVFQDEASQQYACFIDTLTQAEKLVISPIHAVIVILRSRTNNIPFSRFGTISFAVKDPVKTPCLPWHTFKQLPFVVMVSNNEDGSITEAKINMAKIVHAKALMEREVTCPVYGIKRPFYRYCDKVHTPFSSEAMEKLASQLSDCNTSVIPDGLRKLKMEQIHARSNKRLSLQLFSEWINSGFTIGSSIKDSYFIEISHSQLTKSESGIITERIWKELQDYVKTIVCNTEESITEKGSMRCSIEGLAVTPTVVIKYAVEKNWLNQSTDVTSMSIQNQSNENSNEDELENLVYLACEELELLLRETSNDEGESSSVAQGGVDGFQTEDPEMILSKGIQKTVLQRVPGPIVDRAVPVAEDTPGYLPMAFPDVFLTGDGCPHQTRPRSIINSSGGYKFGYLKWVCQQPRAMMNTELQFLIQSMIKRHHSKGKAKLAIKNDVFNNEGLPLKEELLNNAQFRDWTVSNLMMFKSSIPDTTPFWKRARDDAIAVQRDWEDIVPWRGDKTPLSVMMFQTRAPPYNHHPAIHQLCPDTVTLSMGTDEEFMLGRRRNVLKYPSIVSFMCALIAELDTTFLGKLRNDINSYFTRFEWGANANPHSHRLCFSQRFSEKMKGLQQEIELCLHNSKNELLNSGKDLSDEIVQETVRTKVLDCWDQARQEYIKFMRPFYTNWNAGLLADGSKKTFDFIFERQSTTCRLNMAEMIDQALNTGQFSELDTVYVSVVNGTCRHLGHTGLNDQPAKNDKCAVVKRKRIKNQDSSVKFKEVITCKRRKPQPVSITPTIQPDVCNKKLFQLQFESNDKWFNGHDPFEILHILSNADDKAVVPEFLRKPPTINVSKKEGDENAIDLDIQYFADTGDSATEYVTKYAFKDVINAKTPAQVLVTAMEKLEDSEPINQGTVQKMYNVHANAGTTSIFQATHLNQNLPHVLSNVNIKNCNISGLSLFRKDYSEEDGEDYLIPNLIKQFDGRHDTSVICLERGKPSLELKEEIQKDMCLHQFCDLYDVKEWKHEGEQNRVLHFRRRSHPREGRMNALKLIPCHGKGAANPRNKMYWNFCRTLCLWKIPCHKTSDFAPVGDEEDSIKKGWIDLFNNFFINGKGLPPWALKYWKHYNQEHSNDSDTSSDEDDTDFQDNSKDIDNEKESKSKVEEQKESICQPVVGAGHEQFYQNPIDQLRAAQHTTQQLDLETTRISPNLDQAILANPEGVDFMEHWLGDQVLPSVQELHTRMANVSSSKGKLDGEGFDVSTLNEKQKIAHDLVVEYVDERLQWEQSGQKGYAPKPLRLVLMGNPGTGKSWTLKCIMTSLISRLGFDKNSDEEQTPSWMEKIKLAAPTGAASNQMYFNAQTLHRLFCIPINLCEKDLHLDENSKAFSKLLLNFDPKKFILLIIDEFSMVSRQIFAFITQRLIQCSVDIQKIGLVLIGDPAQILPIASDPLWSARLKTDQGKDCSNISILGMMRFREIFNFQQMQTIPNFDKWQNLSKTKTRLLSDEITACRKNLMNGDFSAVFLTEVKRSENDVTSQEFTGKVLVNLRYGRKCRKKEIDFLRKHCATEEEISKQKEWRTANIIHGYHFHTKDNENRPSVEADNAKALLRHNQDTGNPIMRIDSIHHPTDKESKLKTIPAKMFEGAPPTWYASKGMRVMLLRNIAPSVGLYNGSIHTLVGPIYNNDSVEVLLTPEHLQSALIRDHKTTMPIKCSGEGTVIPSNSVLLSINGNGYDSDTLNDLAPKTELRCKFNFPSSPPAMPDFMVIEASNYTGPNILKLPGCDNFVPIAPVESFKEDKNKSKQNQVRIALPLEGGYAATSFKGQGSTFHLAEVDLDGWFHVPGIFLVAISRVKNPRHLHIRKLPNSLDLTMQRMKENVLDAQAFEEAIRTRSECNYRKRENCSDPFWSISNNLIADLVIQEAVSSGKSIKNNSKEIIDKIAESNQSIKEINIRDVICKLMQTKEYLVAEKAPHITVNDFETLQNYQKNKSVRNKCEHTHSLGNIKDTKNKSFAKRPTVKRNAKSNKTVVKEYSCDNHENSDNKRNVRKELNSNVYFGNNDLNKHALRDKGGAGTANLQNQLISQNCLDLKAQPDLNTFTLKGLQNSGHNICFINAAIIALCHSKCVDTFLRECHDIHNGCTGSLIDDEPCPLCALYEVMNRAYRHHRLQLNDIQYAPIIKLTKSLLLGWNIGIEHDADEFLTKLLQRLEETVGFILHKGTVRINSKCKRCKVDRNKEKQQPLRISVNLLEMQNENVRIQDGIMKWMFEEQVRTCTSCGECMHSIKRDLISPPTLLIININRFVPKKTLVDHQILVNDHRYIFRSSINFHPGHYTAVGCVAENHYVYYSDEDVQSCHGRIIDNHNYQIMNRVRTPLEDNSTVLLYDLQTALDM